MIKIVTLICFFILLFSGCSNEIINLTKSMNSFNKTTSSKKIERDIFLQIKNTWHKTLTSEPILTKDKDYIVTISGDKKILLTNLNSGKIEKVYRSQIGEGIVGKVTGVALDPSNEYLVSSSYISKSKNSKKSTTIRVYDFKTNKIIKILSTKGTPGIISYSPDGKYLISTYSLKSSHGILVFDAKTFKLINEIKTDHYMYDLKAIKKDSNYYIYIVSMNDTFVRKINLLTGKLVAKNFMLRGTSINSIAISNTSVTVGSHLNWNPKRVDIFDLDLNLKDEISLPGNPYSLDYSDDGRYLIIGLTWKNGVHIYDTKLNKFINSFKKNENTNIVKSLDNKSTIIIGGNNNALTLWNYRNNSYEVKLKNNVIRNLSLGIDNNIISFGKNQYKKVKDENIRASFEKSFDMSKKIVSYYTKGAKRFSKKSGDYFLEFKKIKSFLGSKPYIVLYKSGKEISKKEYSPDTFTNFGFFDNYIVTTGIEGVISIRDLNFKRLAILTGHSGTIWAFNKYKNFLLSTGADATIKFWNLDKLKNGRIYSFLSLYIDENNEWVMWTPDGYFDSSENGYKYIGFHINQGFDKEAKWVGIEKLYDHFYRPDLVKLALDGKDIAPYTKGLSYVDVLKNPAPEINIIRVNNKKVKRDSIKHYKNKISLKFNVSQIDNGGVGLIRVYQEGKLVKTIGEGKINRASANVVEDLETEELSKKSKEEQEKYLAKLDESVTKSISGAISESELVKPVDIKETSNNSGIHNITLPLKAGKNRIEIEAFNKTNTVASIRKKFTVNAKIKKRKPIVYAIVAGVNKFEKTGRLDNLKYSENDAKAIKNILKLKIKEKVVPTLLLGEDFTKENLYQAIKKIKSKAKLEDKIVFYVSTHGKAINGNLYIVPQNNKSAKNWIKFEDMFKEIQSISALDQVFIIDACESGKAKDIVASIYDSKASVLAKQSGVHILLATSKGTFAFEHPDPKVKHGVFTNNILTALKTRKTDKNRDRKISVIELSKVLKSPEYVTKHQYPVIRNVGQDTKIRDF